MSQTEFLAGSLDTGVKMTTHRTDDETMAPRQTPARATGGGSARLTVLAGPTAVGKGTVAAEIRERFPDIWISVSATTRKPRPNEVHGVHYLFVSDAEFDRMIADGELLEWAVVHKAARYGTPKQPVLDKLAEGRPALLEIDLQGARQVRESMPEAQFVFLSAALRLWHALDENDERALTRALTRFDRTAASYVDALDRAREKAR